MDQTQRFEMVPLETDLPIWQRFFSVSPLVVVGTREPDGTDNLAPKHMATPLGWDNYFGFVCTPQHATYRNIERTRQFTVSFPDPEEVVTASLTASPRDDTGTKPQLAGIATTPATEVAGPLLLRARLHLECTLHRIVDGFGASSLIAGRVVRAAIDRRARRRSDVADDELIRSAPLLAYLNPGRFARIEESHAFPFLQDYRS